jgi:hypothetical protein
MNVIETFLAWYQQLSPNDQQQLTVYLQGQAQAAASTPARRAATPKFGGRVTGPVPATSEVCPTCGKPR